MHQEAMSPRGSEAAQKRESCAGAPVVGVLAVQGAFVEHERKLGALGAHCVELRQRRDCLQHLDALVLPGGESTVQSQMLQALDMWTPLQGIIASGVPVLGTCAGLILLARSVKGGAPCFGSMPVTVRRNAYGRQLASFHVEAGCTGVGRVPMTFIRAPYIESVGTGVEVLACVDGHVVAARYGNQLGLAFHPELDADNRLHRAFLSLARNESIDQLTHSQRPLRRRS